MSWRFKKTTLGLGAAALSIATVSLVPRNVFAATPACELPNEAKCIAVDNKMEGIRSIRIHTIVVESPGPHPNRSFPAVTKCVNLDPGMRVSFRLPSHFERQVKPGETIEILGWAEKDCDGGASYEERDTILAVPVEEDGLRYTWVDYSFD